MFWSCVGVFRLGLLGLGWTSRILVGVDRWRFFPCLGYSLNEYLIDLVMKYAL